ncbi:hypothetical protein EMCRGX_G033057 [Ephydatia muelleri]
MGDIFEAQLAKNIWECSTCDLPKIRLECFRLLETCWGNCHGHSLIRVLREIAGSLLFPSHVTIFSQLCKHLEYVKRNLPILTQYVTGVSVQTSLVTKGFVVERDFIYTPADFCGLENFQLIVILSGIGVDHHWEEAMEFYPSQLRTLISKVVQSTAAKLILCGGRITPTAAQVLREMGTQAIEMVPEDLLYLIAEAGGRTPGASLDSVREADAMHGLCCDLLVVSQKRFVRLECLQLRDAAVRWHPMWCKSVKPTGYLRSLPGGGAWEMALAKRLDQLTSESSDVKYITKMALQKGLLSIALGLYTNALPGKLSKNKMADFYQAATSKEDTLVWVDPATGCVGKAAHEQLPLEPFSTHSAQQETVTFPVGDCDLPVFFQPGDCDLTFVHSPVGDCDLTVHSPVGDCDLPVQSSQTLSSHSIIAF